MSFEDRKEILTIEGRGYALGEEFESASSSLSSLAELTYTDNTTLIPPKTYWRPWKKPTYQKGLFAKKDIKEGTLIGVYEGMVVTLDHVADYKMDNSYVRLDGSTYIGSRVGIYGRNDLRYANHQIKEYSNIEIGTDFECRATKDIKKGDELSWCYGPNLDNSHKEIDSPILLRILALKPK